MHNTIEFSAPPPGVTPTRVLTVAGSDSGGGAGIQADLRTFALAGVHASVAVTAVTAQNSLGVQGISTLPPEFVRQQLDSVLTDIGAQGVKTGMLANAEIISAIVKAFHHYGIGESLSHAVPLIIDPVCASMHGHSLLTPAAHSVLRNELFPLATLLTPNLPEILLLTGIEVVDKKSAYAAAIALKKLGPQWVLVKGGHLPDGDALDVLYNGVDFWHFSHPRLPTPHDHGSGDTLAAAATVALAHGFSVPDAVDYAKKWVTQSLRASYPLGRGRGPVSALWRLNVPEIQSPIYPD